MSLSNNLCLRCVACPGTDVCPPVTCDGCLSVSQPIVLAQSSVEPCNDAGSVTINYVGCPDSVPVFEVLTSDPEMGTPSFTGQVLNFTSTAAVGGQYYNIRFKATCAETGYVVQGVACIGVQNMCIGVVCITGEICDNCTGICIPDPDIIVE